MTNVQSIFKSAFARSGYDYESEEPSELSAIYCESKQVRTRSSSFLTDISKYIPLGLAAKGEGEIELADGITVEHLARGEFETFRRFLGLDEATYLQSFSQVDGGAASDGGRSGSLYWFSSDRRYLLKSSTKSDFEKLVDMMPRYLAHFQAAEAAGRPCLLLRFFGAYRFRAGDEVLGLLCMNDVWDGQKPSRIYDIKGTTHHRYVDEEDDAGVVLKDLNLKSYLLLDNTHGAEVWEAFKYDSEFLEQENSIDYSLLLGLDDANSMAGSKARSARNLQKLPCYQGLEVPEHGAQEEANPLAVLCGDSKEDAADDEAESEPDPRRIRLGIIDFLGQWNTKKKAERWYKNLTACCQEHSSEPPDYYRERWVDFLEDKIVVQDGAAS